MMKRISFCIILMLSIAGVIAAQNLNIGNLTSVKSGKDVIYVAGQKGIAAIKPDLSVVWELAMPDVSVRLLNLSDQGIVSSAYTFQGKEGQLLSAFSSLWDKMTFVNLSVNMISPSGQMVWSTPLRANSMISTPEAGKGVVAVATNDSLYIFDATTGKINAQTYCNEKFLLGKSIKEHAIPNKPLIVEDAIITAAPFKLTKIDFKGKLIEAKEQFGVFQSLPIMTVAPIVLNGKIIFANSAIGPKNTKDGTSRIYGIDGKLDKDWDSFVDVNGQTGVSSLVKNSSQVFLATNYSVSSFNAKGKKLWENAKKIGMPDLRGVRYPGLGSNLGYKVSNGNFLCATEKYVYLASGVKVKKVWTNQILVLDAKTGKPVKTVDVDKSVVDMDLMGENLILITESNKVTIVQ
jgi:hypothetical protein